MINDTYTLQTPDHGYTFTPVANTNNVIVRAVTPEAIEDFISTIELAGTEEGQHSPVLFVEEDSEIEDFVYFTEVSRPTLSLFLDFEVRYYMGAPVG
jgi:hypothetical protein